MDAVETLHMALAWAPAWKSLTKYWPHPETALSTWLITSDPKNESTRCQGWAVPGRSTLPEVPLPASGSSCHHCFARSQLNVPIHKGAIFCFPRPLMGSSSSCAPGGFSWHRLGDASELVCSGPSPLLCPNNKNIKDSRSGCHRFQRKQNK